MVLPETDAEQAAKVAERICAAVAAFPLAARLVEGGILATVSVGVATYPADGGSCAEILSMADQAMYWAKRLGRNQVRTSEDARRAMHNVALAAATASALERREEAPVGKVRGEELLREDQATLVYHLMRILDLRDHRLSSHSYQVSDLAAAIAQEMGLDAASRITIATAALLHDLGMIGLPDALLWKAGPLSPAERRLMQHHPEFGAQVLEDTPALYHLAPALRAHHEHWDGSGYPAQLAREAIPLEARIIAVAEAYQAMREDRPYRQARPKEEALAELQHCAGTHFDPAAVRAALCVLDHDEPTGPLEREAAAALP